MARSADERFAGGADVGWAHLGDSGGRVGRRSFDEWLASESSIAKSRAIAHHQTSAMAGSQSVAMLGAKRSRFLRNRLADELAAARLAGGLSVREVARSVGVSPARIERAERGDPSALTVDLAARMAPVVGLQLATTLHPNGDPVRDRAHLALLDRFRRRLNSNLRWRTEVPMPIAGDLRSGDGIIVGGSFTILTEAETRLTDIQAVERKAALKRRDLEADRLILLIADTPNNRRVLELHPEVHERFPLGTRTCLAALGRGADPGSDGIVIL